MFLLLAIAGISLTANAITWWNGRRTAKVQEQIDQLEAKLALIRTADAKARRALISNYLNQLLELIEQELETRNSIATELTACHAKARSILEQRFGSREKESFLQIVLELELALSRVNGERAYLSVLKNTLSASLNSGVSEIPSPACLQLPNDFPREGGLFHFEGKAPSHLHGYRLRIDDWSNDLGGRAMLFDVDHHKHTAKVSTSGAALLESNLTDGGSPISAKVLRRDGDGIHLEYNDASLILPCKAQDYTRMTPETIVEVFPEVWTLQEIKERGKKSALRVRTQARVGGSRKYWSPILLSVEEKQLPLLVQAYDKISDTAYLELPWRIHLLDSGQVAFTMGVVTLITTADAKQQAFVLNEVLLDKISPSVSIRFQAEITAFVPGTEDDQKADRTLFPTFVEAIYAELGSQKQMLLQRKTALKLRKLSLIYQDQMVHLQTNSQCAFLPGETHQGGRVIIGTIADSRPPEWLDQALSSESGTRLRAVGNDRSWDISSAAWVDRRMGICRLELETPNQATPQEIEPFRLNRLEFAEEGAQQQVLSKALENAILGKFVSSKVHSTLLGLSGDPVENLHLGQEAVENLLKSDAEVVAIWGPPGTGKTTLLVKWLLSLFEEGKEESWPSVLITAPTHVAITKLVTDLLIKAGQLSNEVVRYGSTERIVGTSLEPVWHVRLLEGLKKEPSEELRKSDSWQRWKETMSTREGSASASKWFLGPRHIHVATCVGMARRDYSLLSRPFDIAIIDEAGKAFGAELLIPSSVARKIVLVGDHYQLPPTITEEVLDENYGYRLPIAEVRDLLSRNMFQELFEQLPVQNKGMLTMQYRMHEHIGGLISDLFYEGHLSSNRKEDRWTLTNKRLSFIDFSKVHTYRHLRSKNSTSIENRDERIALHSVLNRLQPHIMDNNFSLLVICPYEAQRSIVEREIKVAGYKLNIKVTTVDAVQGDEGNLVILLMTRSSGGVQFLLDRHRLNVALSRARDAVIIFGHTDCLARNNEGPVAEFIQLGLKKKTLDLIKLPDNPDFDKDIAGHIVQS
jgi:GTPase SAR1 family protein